LLQNCQSACYTLIDFSPQMLELSRSRLARFKDRTVFIQLDFKKDDWTVAVPAGFDLVVSLQAVHELRHASRIPSFTSSLQPARSAEVFDLRSRQSSFASGHRAPIS